MARADATQKTTRVALVTGGAIRVGRLITLGLAAAGFDVVVHYHSSRAEADDVSGAIERLGRTCKLVAGDLADPDTSAKLRRATDDQFGRLDVLVNSAASLIEHPLMDVDASAWDAVMALNARAPHLLVRALAPLLRQSRGSIVNIVDLGAIRPWVRYGVHSVSKGALAHLTRLQARVLAPNVRVNGLLLGDVYPRASKGNSEWKGSRAPLGHPVAEEDVVSAILFLTRVQSMTGSILVLDSGESLESDVSVSP